MDHTTSGGPEDPRRENQRETRATTEGVDAQNANEFDIEHGLAGVEAQPFSRAAPNTLKKTQAQDVGKGEKQDLQGQGLVSERRTLGRDDGVNASTADRDADEK
ncbi:MAG: hypothetical protein EOP13_14990 [Pseudomonas sp.]|uniref:hypothetical protein n=1 Tax=Pseudomonas sp. TaxID=306 RepID=UPI0012080B73|nr:hypothetical protein [Pseudomonas sp.]RZI72474.1 MAG: hypothetical protein EOP13_14990 [Pseudomonas sp.]